MKTDSKEYREGYADGYDAGYNDATLDNLKAALTAFGEPTCRDELDLIVDRGLVVLRDWEGDELRVTHSLTPTKARDLASHLLRLADEADAEMPQSP